MKSPIEPKAYDPTSWDELIHDKREARNRGVTPHLENKHVSQKSSPSKAHRKVHGDAATHLADEFLGLLFSGAATAPESDHSESFESGSSKCRIDKNEGTIDSFFSLKEQEDQKEIQTNSFSFSIQNSLAGAIEITGEMVADVCKIRLRMEKQLNARERQILAQILKCRLSQILDQKVEMTID